MYTVYIQKRIDFTDHTKSHLSLKIDFNNQKVNLFKWQPNKNNKIQHLSDLSEEKVLLVNDIK